MSRAAVRAEFEARFTVERMARAYLDAYRSLLARAPVKSDATPLAAGTSPANGALAPAGMPTNGQYQHALSSLA